MRRALNKQMMSLRFYDDYCRHRGKNSVGGHVGSFEAGHVLHCKDTRLCSAALCYSTCLLFFLTSLHHTSPRVLSQLSRMFSLALSLCLPTHSVHPNSFISVILCIAESPRQHPPPPAPSLLLSPLLCFSRSLLPISFSLLYFVCPSLCSEW